MTYYGGLGWTIPRLNRISCRWHKDRPAAARVYTLDDHVRTRYYVCEECIRKAEAMIIKKKEKISRLAAKDL